MKNKTCWQLLVIAVLTSFLSICDAQDSKEYKCYFEAGKPCPDFIFNNVINYKQKQVAINDFKGKWLILDFWYKGCSACIKSFPATNEEQLKYKDKIQFLLIGYQVSRHKEFEKNNTEYRATEGLYERLTNQLKLKLPCALDTTFCDSVSELSHGMPFIVLIDPSGIVRGSGQGLSQILRDASIDDLGRKSISFRDFYHEQYFKSKEQYKIDRTKPYMVDGNGGPDSAFMFRSLLAKWTSKSPKDFWSMAGFSRSKINDPLSISKGRFEMGPVTVKELYQMACFGLRHSDSFERILKDTALYGKFWPYPLWENNDTSGMKLKYAYSMVVPRQKAEDKYMMQIMQDDLEHYFDYNVSIELRKMPCLRLVANDKAREMLKTKGGQHSTGNSKGFESIYGKKITNCSVKEGIIDSFLLQYLGWDSGMPLIDETGISGNVDITLSGLLPHDVTSFQNALRKSGLDLVKGEKEMKVFVIKDSSNTSNAKPLRLF